jgi:hypothetical protein
MQNKKTVFPHKTPILPLAFATCAISLVPGAWDISRFESVSGLYDHPVCTKFAKLQAETKGKLDYSSVAAEERSREV